MFLPFIHHRPNSYVTRNLDRGTASVTANPNADYAAKNQAADAPVYEMIQTYSVLPPGCRKVPEYDADTVDITTNTGVAQELNRFTTDQRNSPQYEMIRTYGNLGSGGNIYNVPNTLQSSNQFAPEVGPGKLQYAVPRSRHNTMTQKLPLATAETNDMPEQYDIPRSRHNTMTQKLPLATAETNDMPEQYDIPRSRHNTMTQKLPLATAETNDMPEQYDIPRSRHNTMTQKLPLATAETNDMPEQYDIPRSRHNTMTQKLPLATAFDSEGSREHYNTPSSRHNTMADGLPPTSGAAVEQKAHYDTRSSLQKPSPVPDIPVTQPTKPARREDDRLNTYATPRPHSTPSQTAKQPSSGSHLIAIDLGVDGFLRPSVVSPKGSSPAPLQSSEEQSEAVYQNVSEASD